MPIVKNPTARQERVLSQLSKLRHSHETGGVPPSWIVVSVCTTLESAASEKLQALLAAHAEHSKEKLVQKLIKAQRSDSDQSWLARLEWLADGFDIKLAKADKEDLLAMVHLRNAIAHHGDMFTSRQVNKYREFLETRNLLETGFLLHVRGTQFTVTADTAAASLRVGRRITIDLLA